MQCVGVTKQSTIVDFIPFILTRPSNQKQRFNCYCVAIQHSIGPVQVQTIAYSKYGHSYFPLRATLRLRQTMHRASNWLEVIFLDLWSAPMGT